MTGTHRKPNRLIQASSPYLLQHAYNPVDWWEWGDEALQQARIQNKLLLISIGYSACHWCHVMERECFEKEDTAALMNNHFICIKVDREEHPEVDQVYMDAVQLLTGRGGWPLNCFALPDGRPIHGGTYFPKAEWERQLLGIAEFYRENQEEALAFATRLTEGIRQINLVENGADELNIDLTRLLNEWAKSFDTDEGGFDWAPKFPMPVNYQLFLDYGLYEKEPSFLAAVHLTLSKMAAGGIYDQVGGGFARYSTDVFWRVPHFEKMLYDNAQLISLYANAYRSSNEAAYKEVVEDSLAFLNREMRSPEGLFYSAIDADSEGEEGLFYLWTQKELEVLLGEDAALFCTCYSVNAAGNWENSNILYRLREYVEIANNFGISEAECHERINRCKGILLQARSSRVRPGLDDKVITSWNALMIKALVDAYRATANPKLLHEAEDTLAALLRAQYQEGKLYRIYKAGKSTITAFADDYALLTDALIAVYEATGNDAYALEAKGLMEEALRLFYSAEHGLFSYVSNQEAVVVTRRFEINDDVIPSSNSVFAKNLIRLSYLFDEQEYFDKAGGMLKRMQARIEKYPSLYGNWMDTALWLKHGYRQVIIQNPKPATVFPFLPGTLQVAQRGESEIPLLREKKIQSGSDVVYYVCRDKTCHLPVTDLQEAIRLAGL